MTNNRKVLRIGIMLIIITLVICLAISFLLKLDKPVFLQSYVELELPGNQQGYYSESQFELSYITNASDTRVVNNIEFIEFPEIYGYASEYDSGHSILYTNNNTPGRIEGMYSIRTVMVFIDANRIIAPINEIHITKAKISFSDGESIIADIGDIVLLDIERAYDYLEFQSSRGSSDGIDTTLFEANKDFTLVKVYSPLLKYIEELVDIQIDGEDYKDINGLKYSKGDSLQTRLELREQNDPILKYNFYMLKPMLYLENMEGNEVANTFESIYIKEYNFELLDIIKFLRAKEAI